MTMDESERTDNEAGGERGNEPASDPAPNAGPSPAAGPSESGATPPPQLGDQDGARRRRRGRRGRGGGGPGFGAPRPPYNGPRPQFGAPRTQFGAARPQFGAQQFRPQQQFAPREESEQARELAGYERRQAQRQRGRIGGRGGAGGPGRARGGGGRGRQRRGGEQRYSEAIRRVTAGPHTAAPSHEPVGEPIAGPHAILEAIRAGRNIRRLYVSQDRNVRTGPVNELIAEAQQRRIFVRYTDKMEIARLSPVENHQGVVAIVEGKAGVELDELLLHLDTLSDPALVLVVDSLQDPQNFGVLLRSAEGAGVDGVVIPHHRAVGLTPAVTKTSAGASEHLLIADVANLRQAIDALKEKGIWVVAADESGDLLYDEVDYRGPTAIVIGGEGEGIRRLVLEGADQAGRLPMEATHDEEVSRREIKGGRRCVELICLPSSIPSTRHGRGFSRKSARTVWKSLASPVPGRSRTLSLISRPGGEGRSGASNRWRAASLSPRTSGPPTCTRTTRSTRGSTRANAGSRCARASPSRVAASSSTCRPSRKFRRTP